MEAIAQDASILVYKGVNKWQAGLLKQDGETIQRTMN